jgi:protein arginine N-methyltransferase 1
MRNPSGYLITSYGDMVSCEPRMSAYAEALRISITPGCTVLDIGAGFGIFSLLACRFGAGAVIAVEPNDVIGLLEGMAEANGYEDKIDAIQCLSSDLPIGVKADVVVSDLRSCLPLFEGHIGAIVDVRERLLAPQGRLIPARDQLRIALASHPETYRTHREPWLSNRFDLDLTPGHRFAANRWLKVNLKPDDLLSEAQDLALLDYATITDPNLAAKVSLVADRPGEAQGLLVWFDSELAPGISFSNAPDQPELIYGQTFFPLEQPVDLAPGDRIDVEIRAILVEGSYVWSWNSEIWRKDGPAPETKFRQSSFLAKVLSPRKLAARSAGYVPSPREAQAIDCRCLSMFDGQTTLGDIAQRVIEEFPSAFANEIDALNHVANLAEGYQRGGSVETNTAAGRSEAND